jgi:hypothetical protein
LKRVTGPVGFIQLTAAPLGFVIEKLGTAVGGTAFGTPVTVAVNVVVPPRVGFGEAETVMEENCLLIVRVIGALVTPE